MAGRPMVGEIRQDKMEMNNHGDATMELDLFKIQDKDVHEYQPSQLSFNNEEYMLSEESKKLKVGELAQELNINHSKLMRKVDLLVLLPFCILYFVANINRTAYGLLWVNGIRHTLQMTELQFFGAGAAFLGPYVFFQFFSNLILKNIRPHFWMSISVLLYGGVVLGCAFVKTKEQFTACEFLHGMIQSGCDSGVFYILAHYYERTESQKRISFLFSFSTLAFMTNSLCSFGINAHLANHHGLESWRWLLIIEGALTMGIAFILFFILPDFPEGVRFFSDNETLFIVKKLEIYCGKSGYNVPFSVKDVLVQLKDPMVILPGIGATLFGVLPYAFSYIQPISFTFLGWTLDAASRQASWPWVAGFFSVNAFAFASDYFKIRSPFVILNGLIAFVGIMIICLKHSDSLNDPLKYGGDFLLVIGAYSAFPIFLSWATFNLCGHLRKSIVTSLMISMFDLAGIYSLFILHNADMQLHKASTFGSCFAMAAVCVSIAYLALVHYNNKKKRSGLYKDNFEQLSERQKILAGDKSPNFDYMY